MRPRLATQPSVGCFETPKEKADLLRKQKLFHTGKLVSTSTPSHKAITFQKVACLRCSEPANFLEFSEEEATSDGEFKERNISFSQEIKRQLGEDAKASLASKPMTSYPIETGEEIEKDTKAAKLLSELKPTKFEKEQVKLGPNTKSSKKTIALDLDETLITVLSPSAGIHQKQTNSVETHSISFRGCSGEIKEVDFLLRPYTREFLQEVSQDYEIIVF